MPSMQDRRQFACSRRETTRNRPTSTSSSVVSNGFDGFSVTIILGVFGMVALVVVILCIVVCICVRYIYAVSMPIFRIIRLFTLFLICYSSAFGSRCARGEHSKFIRLRVLDVAATKCFNKTVFTVATNGYNINAHRNAGLFSSRCACSQLT